ncbi:BON domain-containing protein [Adhaeretor mobilis]|uniref:Periplasmic protein n=1 Tax=Adhaeretor mobilis TaxID=1930276 RepID=A0A517MZB6_9BACT|nr:BON domain-containing protein [Adhaeretor mobilis]QDT00217.1 periplasmic protein [Adhaeretor mobilis]
MSTVAMPATIAQTAENVTLLDGALQNGAQVAIDKSPYLSDRQMRIEALNGVIKLEGAVNSFFQKQMAQEIMRRVDGVTRVDNQLSVNW